MASRSGKTGKTGSPRDAEDSLFSAAARERSAMLAPLAERMRPRTLDEYLGQEDIVGEGKLLRRLLSERAPQDALPSLIFWGPPGTGKTTLARLLAQAADVEFVAFSAVSSGIAEAREIMYAAKDRLENSGRRTLLFVDEIHRFNKAQQDAFLPSVENGTISLLGATTENPSFEVNNALLSRSRVFVLKPLEPKHLAVLIQRALADRDRGLGKENITLEPAALSLITQLAGGDARTALNALELAALAAPRDDKGHKRISLDLASEALQRNTILYDQGGEEHYNLISALHKSLRHSDPDATLYYLARMIVGGEDPLFIARRLVRAASEDIGLADPQALPQAIAAMQAVELLGYPECDTALAQAAVYLACAPKSNALYTAVGAAKSEVKASGVLPVPLHLRNAPTALMKELDYGKGYQYDQDWPDKISPQEALPRELHGRHFYTPGHLGFEKEIQKRLQYFAEIKAKLLSSAGRPNVLKSLDKDI